MKQLLILVILLQTGISLGAQQCPVIPLPETYNEQKGRFLLSSRTVLTAETASAKPYVYYLQTELERYTGISTVITEKLQQAGIELKQAPLKDKRKGAYALEMSRTKIILTAAEGEGFSNGVSTLLQLVRQKYSQGDTVSVACWNITDAPLYRWRGLMLD